jgi:hypothetical protein
MLSWTPDLCSRPLEVSKAWNSTLYLVSGMHHLKIGKSLKRKTCLGPPGASPNLALPAWLSWLLTSVFKSVFSCLL